MLGQVVIDAQDVLALVHEILCHGHACIGSQVLQRSRLRCRSGDDDGKIFGPVFFQGTGQTGNRRRLLADCHIDTDNAGTFLVDDGINRNGGFAGAAVADDQFALAASDGNHGVNGLNAGLQGYVYRLTVCNTGALGFNRAGSRILNRAFPVDGFTQGVNYTAQQAFAYGHFHQPAGTADDVAFLNGRLSAHQYDAYGLRQQVLYHAGNTAGQFHQFAGHSAVEAFNGRDTVTDLFYYADFFELGTQAFFLKLLLQGSGHCSGFLALRDVGSPEGRLHIIQFAEYGCVVDLVVYFYNDTAENSRVDLLDRFDRPAKLLVEDSSDGLILTCGQLLGRGNGHLRGGACCQIDLEVR